MPSVGKWTRITLHCSATPNGKEYPAETIRNYHKKKGWKDIGYHKVIQPSGLSENGRALNEPGAHVEGANQLNGGINIGICLIGTDRFTLKQFETLRKELDYFTSFMPKWEISCHYEYESARKQGKSCPNIQLRRLLPWYFLEIDEAIAPYLIKV